MWVWLVKCVGRVYVGAVGWVWVKWEGKVCGCY